MLYLLLKSSEDLNPIQFIQSFYDTYTAASDCYSTIVLQNNTKISTLNW